jgi:two-component system, OmpR family, response regulator
MEVEILRWPDDQERLERLRSSGQPRLLLVDDSVVPPSSVDPLEDWTRTTADPRDVQTRVSTLHRRAERHSERPLVDGSGLLHFGGRWVALSPVEAALAEVLVERFGAVVGREVLARSAWREGVPTRNALDVQMVRFRRRIESLGLEVRTVRSRGYLLQQVG